MSDAAADAVTRSTEQLNIQDGAESPPTVPPESTSRRSDQSAGPSQPERKAPCVIVLGMAGTGKTTLMQRLIAHLHGEGQPPYVINLDPAVRHMPYEPNIDIRDTVNYKNVMKEYKLGPNGGILTASNLFATRFDQVVSLCEAKASSSSYFLVDTPGQIEIFTWSASGSIITQALASSFPTVIVYVVDTPRNMDCRIFMSNMLQAVSILYKSHLPIILAFNKVDIASHEFAMEWIKDFDALQDALEEDESYAANLSRSLGLVLDEFYQNLRTVGVSALTGQGMKEFFKAVDDAAEEYEKEYKPELEQKKAQLKAEEEQRARASMDRLGRDVRADGREPLFQQVEADGDDDDDDDDVDLSDYQDNEDMS